MSRDDPATLQTRFCAHCLRPFLVNPPGHSPGRIKIYCSPHCKQKAYRQRRRLRLKHSGQPRPPLQKES